MLRGAATCFRLNSFFSCEISYRGAVSLTLVCELGYGFRVLGSSLACQVEYRPPESVLLVLHQPGRGESRPSGEGRGSVC